MSLDHLPANIERGIQQFADQRHLSHDEAVLRLLETGLQVEQQGPKLGFGHRRGPRKPNLDLAENLPIIGMFPNDPQFDRTMDAIIASRSEHYSVEK